MSDLLRAAATAFAFLTRLPVARAAGTTDRDFGRAVAFFPLVGVALGLIAAGAAYLLSGLFPSVLIALLLVALGAALTGGLHLDGLADLFDGLGGGRGDRVRTLEIMRDSHIGALGTVALVWVLMAKVAAITLLIDAQAFGALVAVSLLARWVVVLQIVFFPYARADGLGRAFRGQARAADVGTATATAAVVLGLLHRADPVAALLPVAAALALALTLAFWLRGRLGGLTGDVYGATIELCETAALFAATLR